MPRGQGQTQAHTHCLVSLTGDIWNAELTEAETGGVCREQGTKLAEMGPSKHTLSGEMRPSRGANAQRGGRGYTTMTLGLAPTQTHTHGDCVKGRKRHLDCGDDFVNYVHEDIVFTVNAYIFTDNYMLTCLGLRRVCGALGISPPGPAFSPCPLSPVTAGLPCRKLCLPTPSTMIWACHPRKKHSSFAEKSRGLPQIKQYKPAHTAHFLDFMNIIHCRKK